jgi:hypothetical protein
MTDGTQLGVGEVSSLTVRQRLGLAGRHYATVVGEMTAEAADSCRAWWQSFWLD